MPMDAKNIVVRGCGCGLSNDTASLSHSAHPRIAAGKLHSQIGWVVPHAGGALCRKSAKMLWGSSYQAQAD